jgi:hypothetical protein
LDIKNGSFFYSDSLPRVLVESQKILIEVQTSLDILPTKQLIIARIDTGDRESSARVAGSLTIKAGLTSPGRVRDKNHRSARERLFVLRYGARDTARARSQGEFGDCNVVPANLNEVIFAARFQIEAVREGKNFEVIYGFRYVPKCECPVRLYRYTRDIRCQPQGRQIILRV